MARILAWAIFVFFREAFKMADNIPKKDFFCTGGTKLRRYQEIKGVIRQGNQSLLIPFESLENPPDGGIIDQYGHEYRREKDYEKLIPGYYFYTIM